MVKTCIRIIDHVELVTTWVTNRPHASSENESELRFHDLRRSATRNILRKGVAATVAMRITGHLTRAVFDAYDVTADQDLLNAAERI